MELTTLREILELDITWRTDELRFFKNQLTNIADEEKKSIYRKSLVLILYAHFEGFSKIALGSYVQYINELELEISDVNSFLKAAALNKEFESYDKLEKKSQVFKKELPDDKIVHRACRRIEFVELFDDFLTKKCKIPDEVVDTDSNLKYTVLKKNLYQIGINIDSLGEYEQYISKILSRRNAIAHGAKTHGLNNVDYEILERKHLELLDAIKNTVYNYAKEQKFLC